MTNKWSKFGERFTRLTGAAELMDDLGLATGGEHSALLLGGGNPGKVPEVQALLRRRLTELAASENGADRMFGNYAHPKGEIAFGWKRRPRPPRARSPDPHACTGGASPR